MNDQASTDAVPNELQFDKADYAEPKASEPVCLMCRQTIPDHYFQINGQILCGRCSTELKNRLTSGSSMARFFKAGLYGMGAAVAGFAIYFGVLKITGLEIGLISILVGYMVGAAVRKGSEARGGLLYQFMAVCFTYLAIAVSYSALVIPQIVDNIKKEKAAAEAAKENNPQEAIAAALKRARESEVAQDSNDGAVTSTPDNSIKVDAKGEAPPKVVLDDNRHGDGGAITAVGFVIAVGFLLGFVLALPVLAGFSQPIGLLIVGFALWEAFKMNRKVELVITGPHNVGPATHPTPANI